MVGVFAPFQDRFHGGQFRYRGGQVLPRYAAGFDKTGYFAQAYLDARIENAGIST